MLFRFRFAKISWRLTIIYAAIFSLVLIGLNAAVLRGVTYFLHHQAANQVNDVMALITGKIEHSRKTLKDLIDEDLVMEIPSNDNIYVKIVTPLGEILNESAKFNLRIPEKIPFTIGRHGYLEKRLLYRNALISYRGKKTAYLQVVKDLTNENHFLQVLFLLMLGADLAGIVCAFFAGLFISKKMLHPISEITETAQKLSIHDLNKRIPSKGPNDELLQLTQTFNAMIDRLQHSFAQQNQFVSDASHELRTPIAVIRGYIDLLDRWGKKDPAILDESIRVIQNEAAGMTELIEKLLFLAHSDNGVMTLQNETIRLDALIDDLIKETRILAPGLTILSERNEPLQTQGDPKLIKQMLRALLDNSIKFTPPGGWIRLDLSEYDGSAHIVISDSGIGIPKQDLSKVFNRFYQVDKARLKSQTGSGLGLAIVKRIVDLHGGSIGVQSREGAGATFTIQLPIMSETVEKISANSNFNLSGF